MATGKRGPLGAAETGTRGGYGWAHVDVHSLERSVNFYSLALGFEVIDVSQAAKRQVLMSLPERFRLSIREYPRTHLQQAASVKGWDLVVDDLDQVRRNLWDLGLVMSRDSGAPDQIYRAMEGRWLYVRDPDAHEIRLVERAGSHGVGSLAKSARHKRRQATARTSV